MGWEGLQLHRLCTPVMGREKKDIVAKISLVDLGRRAGMLVVRSGWETSFSLTAFCSFGFYPM